MSFITLFIMAQFMNCCLYGGTTVEAVPKVEYPELQTYFRCVEAEEGGNSYECKYMAASVIVNRSREWGITIDEVIYQPYQFAVVRTGSIDKVQVSEETIKACLDALEAPADRVMFFSMGNKHSAWAKVVKVIDGEYFYE